MLWFTVRWMSLSFNELVWVLDQKTKNKLYTVSQESMSHFFTINVRKTDSYFFGLHETRSPICVSTYVSRDIAKITVMSRQFHWSTIHLLSLSYLRSRYSISLNTPKTKKGWIELYLHLRYSVFQPETCLIVIDKFLYEKKLASNNFFKKIN